MIFLLNLQTEVSSVMCNGLKKNLVNINCTVYYSLYRFGSFENLKRTGFYLAYRFQNFPNVPIKRTVRSQK